MGQRIEIESTKIVDDSILVTTNRSLTGTDGEGFESVEATDGVDTFAARLAAELFEADSDLTRVWISGNVIVARRPSGWAGDAVGATSRVVQDFFLFYPAA